MPGTTGAVYARAVIMRAVRVFGLVVVAFGCSRTSEGPKPRAFPEPSADGSVEASIVDASTKTQEGPPSLFTLVARAPTGRLDALDSDIANALPLVQRLPGEGLLIASEYGRAQASGPGALVVEVTSDAEDEVFYRRGDVQGAQLRRWVWSDGQATVVSDEEATMRSGPRVSTSATPPKGFWRTRTGAGYWSAVVRDGSVLALERIGYSIPNPMYEHPAPGDTAGALKPASIAVLSGKTAPLAFPPRVCARTMAAAPDGTVVVVVDRCETGGAFASRTVAPDTIGVLRYPPHATVGTIDWLPTRTVNPGDPDDMLVAARSASEIHVGHGDKLETWNGKAWTTSTPFDGDRIISISAGVDGSLWAIARRGGEGGYVTVNRPGGPDGIASRSPRSRRRRSTTSPTTRPPPTRPPSVEGAPRSPVRAPARSRPGRSTPRVRRSSSSGSSTARRSSCRRGRAAPSRAFRRSTRSEPSSRSPSPEKRRRSRRRASCASRAFSPFPREQDPSRSDSGPCRTADRS